MKKKGKRFKPYSKERKMVALLLAFVIIFTGDILIRKKEANIVKDIEYIGNYIDSINGKEAINHEQAKKTVSFVEFQYEPELKMQALLDRAEMKETLDEIEKAVVIKDVTKGEMTTFNVPIGTRKMIEAFKLDNDIYTHIPDISYNKFNKYMRKSYDIKGFKNFVNKEGTFNALNRGKETDELFVDDAYLIEYTYNGEERNIVVQDGHYTRIGEGSKLAHGFIRIYHFFDYSVSNRFMTYYNMRYWNILFLLLAGIAIIFNKPYSKHLKNNDDAWSYYDKDIDYVENFKAPI